MIFLIFQPQFLQIFILRYEACQLIEKLSMLHLKFLTPFLQFFSFFLIFFMLLLQFLIFSLAVLYVFLLKLSFPAHCCLFLVLCHGCPITLDVSSAVCVMHTGCHYAFSPVVTSPLAFRCLCSVLCYTILANSFWVFLLTSAWTLLCISMHIFSSSRVSFSNFNVVALRLFQLFLIFQQLCISLERFIFLLCVLVLAPHLLVFVFKLAVQFFVFSFNVKCVSYYLMVTNRNREHYLLKKCLSIKI